MWWRKSRMESNPYQTKVIPKFKSTPMLWALIMWLCALPLVGLLAAPFLGWKAAAFLAGLLLIADLVICWSICGAPIPKDPVICAKCLKRLYAQVSHTQATKGEDQKKIV